MSFNRNNNPYYQQQGNNGYYYRQQQQQQQQGHGQGPPPLPPKPPPEMVKASTMASSEFRYYASPSPPPRPPSGHVERKPVGPRPPQHQQIPPQPPMHPQPQQHPPRPPYPVDDDEDEDYYRNEDKRYYRSTPPAKMGIPVPPKHTTPPRPQVQQHNNNPYSAKQPSARQQQLQPSPHVPPNPHHYNSSSNYHQQRSSHESNNGYDNDHYRSSSPSSNATSPASMVYRTSSSNTVYSREHPVSQPSMVQPDDYSSVRSWDYDEPADIPPRTSVTSDDEADEEYESGVYPSFISGIKDELNALPQQQQPQYHRQKSPTVKREQEEELDTETTSPRYQNVKVKQEPYDAQPPPPRILNPQPPTPVSKSPEPQQTKIYDAYNRPNFVRGTSVPESSKKRYSHPISASRQQQQQHQQTDTNNNITMPQRLNSLGSSGNMINSILKENENTNNFSVLTNGGIPHSQSASTIQPVQYSSLRSSSRSTDYALMNELNLPSIPVTKQHFDSQKLSSKEYGFCEEVWSIQCLGEWVSLFFSEQQDMYYDEVVKAFTGLFTHYVPTLNPIRAERTAMQVVDTLTKSKFMQYDDKNVVSFNLEIELSGVMPMLTGYGCYTNRVHTAQSNSNTEDVLVSYRCYSSRCSRTLPLKRHEVNINELEETNNNSDWVAYWNLDDEQVSELDKTEVKRQYAIHELIVGEESYIRDLTTLMEVFGSSLAQANPPVMRKQNEFWSDAFGTVQALIDCNTKYLLTDFKHRQQERGPFIDGVADIVLQWAQNAKDVYVNYADTYLLADKRLRNERETNTQFANWFNRVSKDPRTKGVPHSFYFHRAIPRLARYSLLLGTIKKGTPSSHPECQLLDRAIAECDEITSLCNSRLAQVEKHVEILDLKEQIRFKSQDEKVDLRLEDKRRKVSRRGDVTRRGDYRLDWIPTHLILLDNYLVISKIRKGLHGNEFYVTKKPIPLDLLVLESIDGEAVTKSSSSKLGMGTFTNNISSSPDGKKLTLLPPTSPVSPTKSNSAQNNSPQSPGGDGTAVTALQDPEKEVMYPFRITHLGSGSHGATSFTFYAPSNLDRERWKDSVINAKQEYSSAVYALNAEPFRMKVLAGYAFGYEPAVSPKLPVFAPGTALDRALQQAEENPTANNIPRPLAKSRINCGVSFVFADGQEYTLLGLDFGVYVKEAKAGSIWRRCVDIYKVTQIDVVEDLNVVVMLADKALVYYNLDSILSQGAVKPTAANSSPSPSTFAAATNGNVINNVGATTGSPNNSNGGVSNSNTASQVGGYKLSKHREVGFFTVGHMKDRSLLFYKRREGMSSTFKVIEPVKEKGSHRRRSKMIFSRGSSIGSTEYFREVEKFYVPTEAYGLSFFKSSFAVHTTRGFEVMSLDVKTPETVPVSSSFTTGTVTGLNKASQNKKNFSPESLKKRTENSKPIGMFRVSEKSLLLCYEDMAIYTDNHGNLVGPSVIEFVCRPRDVALQHPYLLLFDEEMVEVRRVDKGGQLKQVISGKDIRAIDTKEGQIKMALAHPQLPHRQLVVELINNEFVVEDDDSSLAGL